ncbi:MAG: cysteine protease [Acidobacteriia bacterium]|nr:cysteine protease [Terriglobia bacterium]
MAAILHPPIPAREREAPAIIRPQPFGFVEIPETRQVVGTGWIPDTPDLRDYTDDHPEIMKMVENLGITKAKKMKAALPAQVDLRQWCSPVENQGNLGSCTANAAVGIVEYFEKRAFGKYIDGSRLFVYKTTRSLLGWVGDTGAYLRTTMAALALFGVPPETYWAYTDKAEPGLNNERYFDNEPTSFVYEMADDYECINYFCHDPWQNPVTPANVLAGVKTYLSYGIPAMFGFWGFPSCMNSDVKGAFAYPAAGEHAIWGHAVAAIGYDDNLKITNLTSNKTTTGALLIRNSWGTAWGNNGFGWLPYDYVLSQFAQDFWSLLGMRWIDLEKFQIKTHV